MTDPTPDDVRLPTPGLRIGGATRPARSGATREIRDPATRDP